MIPTEGLAQVTTLAQHSALTMWNSASDFLIIIILTLIFLLFSRRVGRGQLVAVLLSFYCAYALYVMFPYMAYLPSAPALTAVGAHIGLYLALCFMFYIILRRVVVSDFLYIGLFGLILLSFLGTAFLIAMAYNVFSITTVYNFTPPIEALFAVKHYFFWWFVAPAIGLFFFAR